MTAPVPRLMWEREVDCAVNVEGDAGVFIEPLPTAPAAASISDCALLLECPAPTNTDSAAVCFRLIVGPATAAAIAERRVVLVVETTPEEIKRETWVPVSLAL